MKRDCSSETSVYISEGRNLITLKSYDLITDCRENTRTYSNCVMKPKAGNIRITLIWNNPNENHIPEQLQYCPYADKLYVLTE
jgi:hypothetical protein